MLYSGLIVLIVNVCTDAEDVNIARDLKLFTCVSWGLPIDGKGSQAGPIEAVSAHKEPNGWPGRRSSDDASLSSAPRAVDMVDDGLGDIRHLCRTGGQRENGRARSANVEAARNGASETLHEAPERLEDRADAGVANLSPTTTPG